jgi:hypothetical protein
MTSIDDCRVLELPRITRPEGSITPVAGKVDVPFDIARVYYLYDVPGGESRGGHAHRELEQVLVSILGSFDVVLNDGRREKTVSLRRGYLGLYIPNMIWRELVNFSSGAICLVLASHKYSEEDYVREFDTFARLK